MHYYQFNIADFALHTSHLSVEEEGVYRRLLDYYYDTESPIPKETDWVFRRLRLNNHKDMANAILAEFFVLQDDGWHNLRADSEIESYNSRADTARANGKKGGRPKKNKGLRDKEPKKTEPVNLANPEETESKANHELETSNQELIKKTTQAPANAVARFQLPTNRFNTSGETFPVTDDQIEFWQQTYPAVDILGEIRKMVGWLEGNPSKRKTMGGMKRFANSWLAKQQDKGGSPGQGDGNVFTGTDWAR